MADASSAGMADSMPSGGDAAGGVDGPTSGTPARRRTARQLADQSRSCAAMGSRLYAHLLSRASADCEVGGPTWDVLRDHATPGRGHALALRLMAAVHRVVLERRAPTLAAFYPSVGGTGSLDGVWNAFRLTLVHQRARVSALLARPCQTNEVGRSAALAVGFIEASRISGLPLRLREVGASAGLNLRCDHFRVGGGGVGLGDEDSPVDLSSHWRVPPPDVPARLDVVDRRGCDRTPVDPTTAEGRLTLHASLWADQDDRRARLRGALALAERVQAVVDRASADRWAQAQLVDLRPDVVTVIYHSVVMEYLDHATRRRFVAVVRRAAARAADDRPLAWLRVEPASELRHHFVRMTFWPGGQTRTLARCGAHGTDVVWLGDDNAGAGR